MISKTVAGLAFAAGCVLALGATTSAQAQNYSAPQPMTGAPPAQNYAGPQPMVSFPPQPSYGAASGHSMSSPSPTELANPPHPRAMAAGPQPMDTRMPMHRRMMTNRPQASRGDFGGWSARRNNIESAQYTRLLQTNMGFRQARMGKECGPINDPQLRNQCLASFDYFSPVMVGSSAPPRTWNRGAGY